MKTLMLIGFMTGCFAAFAQQVVTGKIVDAETKRGIGDVDVRVTGTTIATRTNVSGYFQLELDSVRDLVMSTPEYDTGRIVLAKELTKFQVSLTKRKPSIPADSDRIFTVVEQQPEFPGGMEALAKYLRNNLKYPSDARSQDVQGKVFVSFMVDKMGSIPPDEIKIIKGIFASCDREAVRLVRNFPKWKPGLQNGKAINARFVLPIRFGP